MVLPFLVPMIVVLGAIIGGVFLTFWLRAIIEVARVILIIPAFFILFKLFGDFIAYTELKLNKTVSTIVGIAFAILVTGMLYIHFWILFIGTAILYGIFLFGPRLVGAGVLANAMSLKSWFKERKK